MISAEEANLLLSSKDEFLRRRLILASFRDEHLKMQLLAGYGSILTDTDLGARDRKDAHLFIALISGAVDEITDSRGNRYVSYKKLVQEGSAMLGRWAAEARAARPQLRLVR